MIISKTKGYCLDCRTVHPARIERHQNGIFFRLSCPKKDRVHQISHDADLYCKIRARGRDLGASTVNYVNLIELTLQCNYQCPICYSSSGGRAETRVRSHEDVLSMARKLKKRRVKAIALTGGEPTMYDGLMELIPKIKALGLKVNLVSNGSLLGKDGTLAKQLKKSGVGFVSLQFDTLNAPLHRKIRGNDELDIKKQALRNCVNAKLDCALVCTVLPDNVNEIGRLLDFAHQFGPKVKNIIFQCAIAEGRFDFEKRQDIYREDIITKILEAKAYKRAGPDSFLPFPSFKPWGISLHPDCAAFLPLIRLDDQLIPFDEFINIDHLIDLLAKNRMPSNGVTKNVVPFYYVLKSLLPGKKLAFFKVLASFILRPRSTSFLIVLAGEHMNRNCVDMARLEKCTTRINTIKYGKIRPCIYGHTEINQFLGNDS